MIFWRCQLVLNSLFQLRLIAIFPHIQSKKTSIALQEKLAKAGKKTSYLYSLHSTHRPQRFVTCQMSADFSGSVCHENSAKSAGPVVARHS